MTVFDQSGCVGRSSVVGRIPGVVNCRSSHFLASEVGALENWTLGSVPRPEFCRRLQSGADKHGRYLVRQDARPDWNSMLTCMFVRASCHGWRIYDNDNGRYRRQGELLAREAGRSCEFTTEVTVSEKGGNQGTQQEHWSWRFGRSRRAKTTIARSQSQEGMLVLIF